MTAETERTGRRATAHPEDVSGSASWSTSWGGTVLRIVILAVAMILMAGFIVVLAELTLTPSPASKEIAGANLRPGHSLRQYAQDYTFLAACKQVGGNLLMGAPFGLLLPVLVARKWRMLRVVVVTGLMMSVVELIQGAIVSGRAFDVDDVILNTSGALLAYLLIGRRLSRRFHMLGRHTPEAEARREGKREREARGTGGTRGASAAARTGTHTRAPWTERVRSAVRRAPVAKKAVPKKTVPKKATAKKNGMKKDGVKRDGVKKDGVKKDGVKEAAKRTSGARSAREKAAPARRAPAKPTATSAVVAGPAHRSGRIGRRFRRREP